MKIIYDLGRKSNGTQGLSHDFEVFRTLLIKDSPCVKKNYDISNSLKAVKEILADYARCKALHHEITELAVKHETPSALRGYKITAEFYDRNLLNSPNSYDADNDYTYLAHFTNPILCLVEQAIEVPKCKYPLSDISQKYMFNLIQRSQLQHGVSVGIKSQDVIKDYFPSVIKSLYLQGYLTQQNLLDCKIHMQKLSDNGYLSTVLQMITDLLNSPPLGEEASVTSTAISEDADLCNIAATIQIYEVPDSGSRLVEHEDRDAVLIDGMTEPLNSVTISPSESENVPLEGQSSQISSLFSYCTML